MNRLNLGTIREYCLKKEGEVSEEWPFGPDVLVFKVSGRIFLLARIEQHPLSINLKCEPELALELRERYEAVPPGYHMNKKLWNTVTLDGSVPRTEVLRMIDHSYDQVMKGKKIGLKRKREKINKTKRRH